MSTDISNPIIAKPQPTFLQRWAYWIIGGVVVIGFANALLTKLYPRTVERFFDSPAIFVTNLFELSKRKPKRAFLPSGYIRYSVNDLTFASPQMEAFFRETYQRLRTRAGNADAPPDEFFEFQGGAVGFGVIAPKVLSFPESSLEIQLDPSATNVQHIEHISIHPLKYQVETHDPVSGNTWVTVCRVVLNKGKFAEISLEVGLQQQTVLHWSIHEQTTQRGQIIRYGNAKLNSEHNPHYWYHLLDSSSMNGSAATFAMLRSADDFREGQLKRNDVYRASAYRNFQVGATDQPAGQAHYEYWMPDNKTRVYIGGLEPIAANFDALCPDEQAELLQQALAALQTDREFLEQHYREIHARLTEDFPLWDILDRHYGLGLSTKEE